MDVSWRPSPRPVRLGRWRLTSSRSPLPFPRHLQLLRSKAWCQHMNLEFPRIFVYRSFIGTGVGRSWQLVLPKKLAHRSAPIWAPFQIVPKLPDYNVPPLLSALPFPCSPNKPITVSCTRLTSSFEVFLQAAARVPPLVSALILFWS